MANIKQKRLPLSVQHKAVVDAYMKHYNKAQALRDAGYAESTALRNVDIFQRRDVQEEIERRQQRMAKKAEVDADYVIQKFKDIVEADLGDLLVINEDGTAYFDFNKARPEHLAALSEFTVDEISKGRGENAVPVSRIRVKLHDKLRALEALGKHLGLFTDKIEVKGELDLIKTIEERRRQVNKEEE